MTSSSNEPPEKEEGAPPEVAETYDIPSQRLPNASEDERAESEVTALAFEMDLVSTQTDNKLKKLKNRAKVDGTISIVLRILIWSGLGFALISFTILFIHFLAPEHWLFLSPERIQTLQELLFSSTVGVVLGALWEKQRDKDER